MQSTQTTPVRRRYIASETAVHRCFAPVKRYVPASVWRPIKGLVTAVLTPMWFSYTTGHLRSSFKLAAVTRKGEPLPWYTYPCIHFLQFRDFQGKKVLEFGGGQSTLWWAGRAERVVTLDPSGPWCERLKTLVPANVTLHEIPMDSPAACVEKVNAVFDANEYGPFDVIVIDGMYRYEMIEIALRLRSETGVVIADDAEIHGFHEGFKPSGLQRIDFFGHQPAAFLPHCTSIFFDRESFLFSPETRIPAIAVEG